MQVDNRPDPILRVTIGSPVYTQDDQKLGTVKERRGNAFKVGTPLLQRDFWLAADSVAEATPDVAVILAVSKTELEGRKLKGPPAA